MTSAGLAPSPALAHMSASKLPMPISEPSSLLPPHEFSPSKVRISGFEGSESELSEAEESSRGSPVRKGTKRSKANGTATKGEECEVCHSGEDGTKILLCDGCDQGELMLLMRLMLTSCTGYHIYCLEPPLPAVPTHEQWYCTACLFGTGNDYGFDEGEEHSIHSFQLRDKAFREAWFETHPPASASPMEWGPSVITENDVETEFWRLVESQHETVEVEYGADVHSTTHGRSVIHCCCKAHTDEPSGAPTLETDPLAPYSADPWNLNNMPILPDSLVCYLLRTAYTDVKRLLRYIKSDISGMTVPWIYIGMLFSTFCWHNEDHYTYSINYSA
jgi:histone demethylase JARID1